MTDLSQYTSGSEMPDGRLTSKRSCTYKEFQEILHFIAAKTGKNIAPDYPKAGSDVDGYVTYHVVRATPYKAAKPRKLWEGSLPQEGAAEVWSDDRMYTVQFNCWSLTNAGAEDLAEEIERFILQYAGIFKSYGVQQIVFDQRLIDGSLKPPNERLLSRSLRFSLVISNIWVKRIPVLDKIKVELSAADILDGSIERFV
jgi:hypothetical protein